MDEQLMVRTRTRLVHCRREPFGIYIGRSMPRYPELRATGWDNPFRPTPNDPDAGNAIARYREWLMGQPRLGLLALLAT